MTLLNPAGLVALGLVIPVIVLHILRPRRTEMIVGSTLLWKELEKPVSAAAPWQKLRPSILLFLQLLAVVLLSLALANPAVAADSPLAAHTVFIVDGSGSMLSTDGSAGTGNRIDAAEQKVIELLDRLPNDGSASLVVADGSPEVVISGATDPNTIRRAMAEVKPDQGHPDWLTAFSLAESLEVPGEDIGFVLVSDGGLSESERQLIPTGTVYERVGVNANNVAIASLTAAPRGGGLIARSTLRNYGDEPVVAQLRIDVDTVASAKRRVSLKAGETVPVDLEVPAGERVEAFLDSTDALELDDYAVALADRQRDLKVVLSGVENPAITAVFGAIPGVTASWSEGATSGAGADLLVLNEVDPPADLAAPALVFAAPNGVPGAAVKGSVDEPAVTLIQVDDPLLTNVDLSDTGIGVAQQIEATTAEVLVSAEGAPLILRSAIGTNDVVYVAFRLPDSNFYVQVAFPLFVDRVIAELARSAVAPPQAQVGDVLGIDTALGGVLKTPAGDDIEVVEGAAPPRAVSTGFWTFTPTVKDGDTAKTVVIAVNPDETESDIRPETSIPIPERTRKFGTTPPPALRSQRSWVILAVLAVLAVEWLVARRRIGVPRRQWRVASALRVAAALTLIFALFGVRWQRGSDRVATMFLVDGSASVGSGGRSDQLKWLGDALAEQPDESLAGVAIFGGDARLESTLRTNLELDALTTKVDSSRTNLEGALRLAGAVLPEDAKRRIVLMSDGRQTEGDMRAEIERLAERGIVVETIPIERSTGVDVAVESVDAPMNASVGDKIVIAAIIDSSQAFPGASVELTFDGAIVATEEVDLKAGANRVEFATEIPDGIDVARYRVQVRSPGDQVAENDSGFVAIQVKGKSKVLVVEGEAGRGTSLVNALRAGGLLIDVVVPQNLPEADSLAAYQGIVLADVSVPSFTDQQLDDLAVTTRDLGRGLVTVGGTHSYALGGYRESKLEKLLPVISDVLDPKRRVTVAEVLAIDTSGSMGACHCGANGNGNNSAGGGAGLNEGGVNKTDIARAAAERSVDALSAEDEVGILGIDNNSRWIADITNLGTGGEGVRDAIDGLRHTQDGTDLTKSLTKAADALKKSKAGLKHVILFTDGFTGDNVLRDVAEEAAELKDQGITVSVLSTGETSSVALLEEIATAGGGRFYAGTNLRQIPEIMAQETVVASRNFINEGEFFPEITSNATVIRDLDASPPLLGFLATTAKPTASALLRIGPERDPLLSTWQNGLGRSTAWTSDASARWSKRWADWDGYVAFWTNVVKDSLPTGSDDISVGAQVVRDELKINVDAVDAFGDGTKAIAKVSGPGLDGVEVALERSGDTSFTGTIPAVGAGTYRVGVSVSADGSAPVISSALANRFYPAEFKPGSANPDLLVQMSKLTGGRGVIEPTQSFDSADLVSGTRASDAGGLLTLLALAAWFVAFVLSRLTFRRAALDAVTASGGRAADRIRSAFPAPPGRERQATDAVAPSASAGGTGGTPAAAGRKAGRRSSANDAPKVKTAPATEGTVGSLLDAKRRRANPTEDDESS